MLKSISFIHRLKDDLYDNIAQGAIINFHIELLINQNIDIHIVSDEIQDKNNIALKNVKYEEFKNPNISVEFLSKKEADTEEYSHLFRGEKYSIGLRRSLGALLNESNSTRKFENLITFFSYKGGVGRTTSLALTATYLARKSKNVFVLDCDFEAPGLINFFNSAQADVSKNGLIEYLNDRLFDSHCNISDYVFEIEKSYSGSGSIKLMQAGNIFQSNSDLTSYLEGLAKLGIH